MINVGLIPLDSRPCNTSWVCDLARIGNANVIMYPREKCGTLHSGAKLDCMLSWLEENVEKMDYLIISSDGLSFGGLIQARLAQIDLDDALEKFKIFKELKSKYPHLKIYMFDTCMRTSITAIDEESQFYWSKMNEYSLYKGRVHFFNTCEDQEKLTSLENEIPERIISSYLKARSVKFTLNKFFLSLVKEKVLDSYILLQEDSMPYGIQQIEHEELKQIIKENDLEDKVQFYNGTDEGAVVLLGKILMQEHKMQPNVFLHVPDMATVTKCFLFEDRPGIENIEKMCKTIGFNLVDSYDKCDFVLSIFSVLENDDLIIEKYIEININKNETYLNYVNELNSMLKKDKPVVLVDLLFPNGGSLELLKDIDYKRLATYSAWNTASNSLGSAMCQIAAVLVCNDKLNEFNQKFLYERIFDDCIYQYVARRKASERLISEGCNIFDLKDRGMDAINYTKEYLDQYLDMIPGYTYEITLPWNRMFEAEIILKK